MADPIEDLQAAHSLPEDDVIRLLLAQHARIRTLFTDVRAAEGQARYPLFAELRALLAVHETAEQLVLRRVSREAAGEAVTRARTEEEAEATHLLAQMEETDPHSTYFAELLDTLETAVTEHQEVEERSEFTAVLAGCTSGERQRMGALLQVAESVAPTRAHPGTTGNAAATVLSAPIRSLVDRTRDAIERAG